MKTELVQAIELNAVLTNDFINSESAAYVGDKLILNKPNKSALIYHFNDRYIVRIDEETTDTFKLAASQVKVNYLPESSSALINELSFVAHVLNEKEHFYFSKNYSAETALNGIQNTAP